MSNNKVIRVAAVMTVFNRVDLTLACLSALQEQQNVGLSVDAFVVDDGSSDGTAAAVASRFPEVVLLRGSGNLFWGGGMWRAFHAAMERDYDYYLWMNDDVRLDPEALRRLLHTSQQLRNQGERRAIVVGSMRDPDTGELTYGGVERPSRLRPMHFELVRPGDTPRRCETMNGNCVLIPRVVARAVGNVDRAFVQKMGDYDYGLRAVRAGCSIWVAPGTVGTCARHPPRDPRKHSLPSELRRVWSTKQLPPRPWGAFVRRWGGPLWPVFWLSPYVKRGVSLGSRRFILRMLLHKVPPSRRTG